MNFEKSEIFLTKVNNIYSKIPKREKTFMEISRYPYYENVCSNILAFYLNPKEEHKLGSLLINSLLKVVKNKGQEIYKNIDLSHFDIYREYITQKRNRIDIVMQNEEIVIGIENKIYSSVYNDLDDYAKTLNNINNDSIKLLLSINQNYKNTKKNGFINITYSEFFKQLKEDLKVHKQVENKWYIYLIDFINSIEKFEVKKSMELEINNWINTHKEEIKKFEEILNIAKKNINKKLKEYAEVFEYKIGKNNIIKYWYDKNNINATAFILFNQGYNLDVNLNTENWKIGIFIWKKTSQFKIKEILKSNNVKYIEENGHLWLYEFKYDMQLEVIINKSIEIYNIIKLDIYN